MNALRVCLVVPSGDWAVAPLAQAVRTHHPDAAVAAVWCGDPHRRRRGGAADDVPWCDVGLAEPSGVGWGRLLVASAGRGYELARTAAAVGRLLDAEASPVIVLRVGSVVVVGPLDPLVGDQPLTLVPRTTGPLPDDGLAPTEADLVAAGRYGDLAFGVGPGGGDALAWLARHSSGLEGSIGPLLDRAGELFGASVCTEPGIGIGGWRCVSDQPSVDPVLVDVDALDRDEPWHFAFESGPSRVRLSADDRLAGAVAAGLPQRDGRPEPIRLPGGIRVDGPIRTLMADALRRWRADGAALPPEPFGPQNSAFVRWLEEPSPIWGANVGRYWRQLREDRADLLAAFPRSDSADQDRYIEWTEHSWRMEERSVLLRPSAGSPRIPIESVAHNHNGINVTGYLGFDSSLGEVGRRIVDALQAAHVPVSPIDHYRTGSPRRPTTGKERWREGNTAHHATNLVVVNADQFHFFVADHQSTLLAGRKTIGYWFWELETVPDAMVEAIDQVDEIWVGSRFVGDAFARVTDKPVRWVPIPVPEPVASKRARATFGLPDDRYVFTVTFDHFSVAERKNPYGAVEAFRRAFSDGEGPVLFVKTVNGDKRWQNHERLLLAAAGRSDIVILDEHLDRADQMAALVVSDCLISLHRSEGLGLHCAEAMWLGKPVIATRYSGNLDFMDDDNSVLVDYTLVPVEHGEGVYPPDAVWADPDLDQAAAWMRKLVAEPDLGRRLGARARQHMARQPKPAHTGRTIAQVAALGPYVADPATLVRSSDRAAGSSNSDPSARSTSKQREERR